MKYSFLLSGVAALVLSACAQEAEVVDTYQVTFIDHVKGEMTEQDVFVEKVPGSGEVYRVRVEEVEEFKAKPAFASAAQTHHDPMNADSIGPFPKGPALGFTVGEWLAASGTGKISCAEGKGHLDASFENLVPNGVYTMWHYFVAWPLTEPFSSYDLPVGARDGSESPFIADGVGNAAYSLDFEPCLQASGEQLIAGVAIAYHSDGKTYGDSPGSFGDASHVHLFADLPVK